MQLGRSGDSRLLDATGASRYFILDRIETRINLRYENHFERISDLNTASRHLESPRYAFIPYRSIVSGQIRPRFVAGARRASFAIGYQLANEFLDVTLIGLDSRDARSASFRSSRGFSRVAACEAALSL